MSALRAGLAVEHLQLAALYRVNPLLVASADTRGLGTRVRLLDDSTLEPGAWVDISTVSMQDATGLLRLIYPQLELEPGRLKDLVQVRNAAAHLASVRAEDLDRAVKTMANTVEQILNVMGANRGGYWTVELLSLVTMTVLDAENELSRRVEGLLIEARARLADLDGRIDAESRETTLVALEAGPVVPAHREDQLIERCPACRRKGWLELEIVESDELSEEHDDDSSHYWFERVGFPRLFTCPVCGVLLRGPEMKAAGMYLMQEVELDPRRVPVSDAEATWEPDEDWIRGR